jgi:hypothetical protein
MQDGQCSQDPLVILARRLPHREGWEVQGRCPVMFMSGKVSEAVDVASEMCDAREHRYSSGQVQRPQYVTGRYISLHLQRSWSSSFHHTLLLSATGELYGKVDVQLRVCI